MTVVAPPARPPLPARVVIERARARGFHRAAVVPLAGSARVGQFQAWLAAGHHGEMAYLARPEHLAARADPGLLLPEARALLVVALAYPRDLPAPPDDGLVRLRGRIARYASGEDYHLVVRDKLAALAEDLAAHTGQAVACRPCVDSAPLLERELAERGGLGFAAKNTMLIAPGLGSYVVLGELLLAVDLDDLPAPAPDRPRCGSCRACLDACPTAAFVDAYLLDARRCISYLTIEHDGDLPRDLRAKMGTWVFGCDVCQEVCPFNAGAGEPAAPELAGRDLDHARPDLIRLAGLGAAQLRRFVRRTALRRVPQRNLLRNVAVALGNSGDPGAAPALLALLAHAQPRVRAHAAWGLAELARTGVVPVAAVTTALTAARAGEATPAVVAALTCELDELHARPTPAAR